MHTPRHLRWAALLGAAVALAACSADPTPMPKSPSVPAPTATSAAEPTAAEPTAIPVGTIKPIPGGAVTVTLGASQDVTLYDSPGSALANGGGEYLFVGLTGQPQARRTLIAFDVAGVVPAGATVFSVELTLQMSRTGLPLFEAAIALHRTTASWGEGATEATGNEGRGLDVLPGDATWLHRTFDDQLWATPGGGFASAASATTGVLRPDPYTWGPTAAMVTDVQAWLDDPGANHGWAIVGDEETHRGVKRFDSRQRTDETTRPVLTVVYRPAGG